MELLRVHDEPTLTRWQAVQDAAYAAEYDRMPADPIEEARVRAFAPRPSRTEELWLGVEDGADVAAGALELPQRDNLGEVEVDLHVDPSRLRCGHGSAALATLTDRCRELGRSVQLAFVHGTGTASEAFARHHGFEPKSAEVRRILDVAALPDLDALESAALPHAAGYSFVSWVDRAPDDAVAGLADLGARMSTDAPHEELSHEPEVWDAARWRENEQDSLRRDRLHLGTHALFAGEVVAYTDLGVARSRPEIGYQWDTLVRADHRGHRLGLLLKIATLRLLRDESPATRWVNTWNAGVNGPMIAINELLGYEVVDTFAGHERRL